MSSSVVFGLTLLAVVIASGFSAPAVGSRQEPTKIRVMTFNIWFSGMAVDHGVHKVANQIKEVGADIVAIQEVVGQCTVKTICKMLGGSWKGLAAPAFLYNDIAILTHFDLDTNSGVTSNDSTAFGVVITLPSGQRLNTWALHLDHTDYGPYTAHNLNTDINQIILGEQRRINNIQNFLSTPAFVEAYHNSDAIPLIAAGDFNTPSHVDWIESAKHLHNEWVVEWPVTTILEKEGFVDSFRQVHPNPVKAPGNTWSTVKDVIRHWFGTAPEPKDRIDFIMYKGGSLKPINSFIYAGSEPIQKKPNHKNNSWPSDHYAVVTDFLVGN